MIKPHGGILVNKIAEGKRKKDLEEKSKNLFKLRIHDRYISDCEMIANGSFSPLRGFMRKEEVETVVEKMCLPDGTVWAIPILLPIKDDTVQPGDEVALVDKLDRTIAIMKIEEKFKLDIENLCLKVFKTKDIAHPGVKTILENGNLFIGGEIELLNRPIRENIKIDYFLDPSQTRKEFEKRGWKTIVAFQTRNPIHRAHEYLIKCALEFSDGVHIHPLVGETKADDIPAPIRIKCYEVLIENYFNKDRVLLSVLPTSMKYAGPREAIHHIIIRKNYGCTHMIIGRDHAGIGSYYGEYEAQELVDAYAEKLEIQPIKFEHSFYCKRCENMASTKTCPHPLKDHIYLSGTKLREMLREGKRPPKEFSRPEVIDILMEWIENLKSDESTNKS
jgi:sulfate adenylyltransferase